MKVIVIQKDILKAVAYWLWENHGIAVEGEGALSFSDGHTLEEGGAYEVAYRADGERRDEHG